MQKADVTVIGAGPIGSYLSEKLAGFGLDVAIFERKTKIGKCACSGLVSRRLSSFVKVEDDFLEHKISGAVFHSPGASFSLSRKRTEAYVIDRPAFDRHVFSRACGAGARAFLGAAIGKIEVSDKGVICAANELKVASGIVVGADGACSFLRGALGIGGKLRLVNGIISYTNEENKSPDVELFFGQKIAPGFFAWKIPRGKRTEYGLAANKNHVGYFKKFLKSFGASFGKFYAHPIVFGEQKTCHERAILVGDAALQVKPFSGGGIIYGLISADIAARAIKKAFDREDFSRAFFEKEYEAKWHEKLLPKIRAGMALRETLDALGNEELDSLFSAIAEEKSALENFGDMDFL